MSKTKKKITKNVYTAPSDGRHPKKMKRFPIVKKGK